LSLGEIEQVKFIRLFESTGDRLSFINDLFHRMSDSVELQVGDTLRAYRAVQAQEVDCKIIRIRQKPNGDFQYLVHYNNLNRRWDEWTDRDSLNLRYLVRAAGNKSRKGHAGPDEEQAQIEYLGEARNHEYLRFSHFTMKAWYYSPTPEPYHDLYTLYCCEFCFGFFCTEDEYVEHCHNCTATHPPGDEIYKDGRISVYEIDGLIASRYCVNLCLVTRLFLHHKTEFYDTRFFNFYIVCLGDVRGAHPAGFFSKEKNSVDHYNLACIECFPCYQRMGIGTFLISLSYEFSKIEKQAGTPEKPLSDLGWTTYRAFWRDTVLEAIVTHQKEPISIMLISQWTGMTENDVTYAIRDSRYLRQSKGELVFGITDDQLRDWQRRSRKRKMKFDPSRLRWTPYLHTAKKGEI
jgi:hypothetical protein